MSITTLDDVLFHGLKDLLSAEKQFRDALPKLAEAAESPELADAFESHREETITQIERLEKCFELLGRAERSEKCKAAAGITAEGESMIKEEGEAPAKDVMLVAAGRKAEHYEIASYDDAIHWATTLGHNEVASLLRKTLEEEKAADKKLCQLGTTLSKQTAATPA